MIEIFKLYPTNFKMFAKFKSLLSKQSTSDSLPLEDSLTGTSQSQIPQCPFSKKGSLPQGKQQQKCPVTGKAVPDAQINSDSEEEKPKGGCPFMGGTSDKKKNPSLNLNQEGFDEPFISKFRFYLSANKLDFSRAKRGLPEPTPSREIFDQLPIYLQHTLFYNGEDYQKVRALECCSRFMAYEQLREKGNKLYNKGKFYDAIEFYQRAMSLFRWMEHQEPQNLSTTISEQQLPLEQSFDEASENGSKVNISLGNESAEGQDTTAAFDELKAKYKQFFITYSDDNTKICDGEDMFQSADIDMRKSLLCQAYLNLSAAYMCTHHYSLAQRVCNDGLALTDMVSQLYFRKAQSLSLRRDCSLEQLAEAKRCITIAIEKRSTEKIFATANQNILKMLNIHDSAQAYEACRKFVEARIEEVTKKNNENYSSIYERMREICNNELRIIEEGKIPQERREEKVLRNTTEMKILSRMLAKYAKVIDFYTEAKNPEQVTLAKKEFQEVLRINHEVNSLFQVTLKQEGDELGGLESEKVQARVDYVKTAFAEQIYNGGKFNFTMLEWVIKEIVKEERQEEEAKEKQLKAQEAAQKGEVSEKPAFGGKLPYMLILLPLLAILLSMLVL